MGIFSRTPSIDARDAARRLAAKEVVLLDVREHAEWRAGHIHGALHLPLAQLRRDLQRVPTGRTVVTVCASGSRSRSAARALARAGYDALNLSGGMSAWLRAGLPLDGKPARRR